MTRDEWILEHVPAVQTAVRAFCRRYSWVSPSIKEDLEGESFLRLTIQADRLAKSKNFTNKPSAYVFRLTWNSCYDYVKKHERELDSIPADNYCVDNALGLAPYSRRCFLGFHTFFREYNDSKGVGSDYNGRERIPMSEDMSEEGLAALEAFLDREPKSAWQRTKLKRRALDALRKFGIIRNGDRIREYTARAKNGSRLHDGAKRRRDA